MTEDFIGLDGSSHKGPRESMTMLAEWGASGFRSAFMLRELDWLHELRIKYDASTFDTDPFEPQPEGCQTIFPFWVPHRNGSSINHQR